MANLVSNKTAQWLKDQQALSKRSPTNPTKIVEPRFLQPPPLYYNFHCSILNNSVSIKAGNVRMHGVRLVKLPNTILSCVTSPMYVYVSVPREANDQQTSEVVWMSEEPQSDYVTLRLPLVTVESKTHTYSWGTETIWEIISINHLGDFDFDMPLR